MPSLQRIKQRLRNLWRPAPLREFSDYDDYWTERGSTNHVFRRWVLAADLLPQEGTVLDVGSGSGEFLTYLRSRRPNLKLSGVDISERSAEMTRAAGFDARAIDLLKESLPQKFDFITCLEVIEHIPDAEIVVGRLRDACEKRLLISIPNVGYIGCRLRLLVFGRFPLTNCVMHIKEHVRFWSVRDFREWSSQLGLRVVSYRSARGLGPMQRFWPSLFASTVLYELEPIERRDGASH